MNPDSKSSVATATVGTSGWHYSDWRGRFYPPDLKPEKWLDYYARQFSSVEINNSFYRLPSETALVKWRADTPNGFVFALKGSRLITHYRKLRSVEDVLDLFYRRVRILGDKLGPVLYQLPPSLRFDPGLLRDFLALLPSDVKHAVEFRHDSWFNEATYASLSDGHVAFCVFHLAGMPCPRAVTAPLAYVRFHGAGGKYWGNYTSGFLDDWAQWITNLTSQGHQVFVYFNNDMDAAAVDDASALLTHLRRAWSQHTDAVGQASALASDVPGQRVENL